MVEHYLDTVGVTGSNPVPRTSFGAKHNELGLGQIKAADKSNEITALPGALELSEAIFTIDAMGCQKKIAKEIIEADADRSPTRCSFAQLRYFTDKPVRSLPTKKQKKDIASRLAERARLPVARPGSKGQARENPARNTKPGRDSQYLIYA